MNQNIHIGIDIGYGNTKSRHSIFQSGVKRFETEPPLDTKVVEYNGQYYSVDNMQETIPESKVEDESTLILTMAAIAEELKKREVKNANIRLGIGLPLTRVGSEKDSYKQYMLKNRRLNFKYEGKSYSVYLISVDVFPQGYAGIVNRLNELYKSAVVVDIGTWTVDILPLIDGKPEVARCRSLTLGTMTVIEEINEKLRQKFGTEAEEVIIREIMISGKSNINTQYLRIIQEELKWYVQKIMDKLRSLKINMDLTQVVVIGGGAVLVQNFLDKNNKNLRIINDVFINAKGYEDLLNYKYRGDVM